MWQLQVYAASDSLRSLLNKTKGGLEEWQEHHVHRGCSEFSLPCLPLKCQVQTLNRNFHKSTEAR